MIFQEFCGRRFFIHDLATKRKFEGLIDHSGQDFLSELKAEVNLKKVKAKVINTQFTIFSRIKALETLPDPTDQELQQIKTLKQEHRQIQVEIAGLLGEDSLADPPAFTF